MERITFTKKKEQLVFKGRLLKLKLQDIHFSDGTSKQFEVIEHPGSVVILPVFEDGAILLIKQLRPAVKKYIYEFPAGLISKGETSRKAALRELREETGFKARKLTKIAEFYATPGFCDEKMEIFLARQLTEHEPERESDEKIELMPMEYEEAMDLVKSGKICDAKTIIGLCALRDFLEEKSK